MKNTYRFLLTLMLGGYWMPLLCQSAPQQGEIVITEIMVNPEAVSDANGEWFEIWNATDHDLLLTGLSLKDAGSNLHVITAAEKVVIPAHGYWVFAKNEDAFTNGGVTVNYVYQNFTLSNSADQLMLTSGDGTLIDQVSYSAGWPVVSGASMELIPEHHSFGGNDQPDHWQTARLPYGAGDKGSPGKANPFSAGLEEWEEGIRLDVYPNPTEGRFILEVTFTSPMSGEIRFINLLGQDFIYKSFTNSEVLREIVEAELMTPGIWFVEVVAAGMVKSTRLIIDR
jgi:hypothetical protein